MTTFGFSRPRGGVRPAARQLGPVTHAIRTLRPNEAPTWEMRQALIDAEEREALRALRKRIGEAPALYDIEPSLGSPARGAIRMQFDPNEIEGEYALRTDGNCLEPIYKHDSLLMFCPEAKFTLGDFVVIYIKPEYLLPNQHQAIVKRVVMYNPPPKPNANRRYQSNIEPCLVVEQLNPGRCFTFPWQAILAVHKCLGEVPADIKTHRVTDDEFKQRNAARKLARAKREVA